MKKALPYSLALALLLLALGVQYRIEAWQAKAVESRPVSIPYVVGGWHGYDLKMERTVVEMLNPDTLVFRRYRNPEGVSVDLFSVFYHRQRSNQTFHSPANCYPGSGWDFSETRAITLRGENNPELQVSACKASIRKGLERRTLYYWYQAGGRTAANPYWNKLLMFYNAVVSGRTDGGLVTVSSTADDPVASEKLESDFLPLLVDQLTGG